MKSAVAVSGWVTVIIPALNEEEPIAGVVRAVAAQEIAHEIIVVDNGSNDDTARRARDAGAGVSGALMRAFGMNAADD